MSFTEWPGLSKEHTHLFKGHRRRCYIGLALGGDGRLEKSLEARLLSVLYLWASLHQSVLFDSVTT